MAPAIDTDDLISRRAHVRHAIRMVADRKAHLRRAVLFLTGLAAWYFRGDLAPTQMTVVILLLIALVAIHDQLCELRIDSYQRELRDLVPE